MCIEHSVTDDVDPCPSNDTRNIRRIQRHQHTYKGELALLRKKNSRIVPDVTRIGNVSTKIHKAYQVPHHPKRSHEMTSDATVSQPTP